MRRIFDENLVYTQDSYEFNMYYLSIDKKDFLYQLSICKTDDYHIGCDVNVEKFPPSQKFSFFINRDNLFYSSFSKFLENKEKVTIQDDLALQQLGKKLTISNQKDDIELLFEYEKESLNPYDIHVINVVYDGRSQIDQKGEDTKERLFELCDTLYSEFKQYDEDYDGQILKTKKKIKVYNHL